MKAKHHLCRNGISKIGRVFLFPCHFYTNYLDLLSANLIGYTTLKKDNCIIHLIAISSSILCPTDTKIGFIAPLVFLRAVPQIRPLSPFNKLKSPTSLIYFYVCYFTLYFPRPSIKKNVLPTPIVGRLRCTPKWHASPHWFWWSIPLPSTITNWGQNSGFFNFSLENSYKSMGTYLNPKKPGI